MEDCLDIQLSQNSQKILSVLKCLGTGFGALIVYALSNEEGKINFIRQGIVITTIMVVVFFIMQFGFKKEVPRETRKMYREWVEG